MFYCCHPVSGQHSCPFANLSFLFSWRCKAGVHNRTSKAGGLTAPLDPLHQYCCTTAVLQIQQQHTHTSAGPVGQGGWLPPLPPATSFCVAHCNDSSHLLVLYVLVYLACAAAQQYWWRGSRGAVCPPASQVQQLNVCVLLLYLLHEQQYWWRGSRGADSPPASQVQHLNACVLLLYLLHEQQYRWRGSRGAVSPPASQVQQLNVCVLLLYLLHEQQHSSTGGGGQGGQSVERDPARIPLNTFSENVH